MTIHLFQSQSTRSLLERQYLDAFFSMDQDIHYYGFENPGFSTCTTLKKHDSIFEKFKEKSYWQSLLSPVQSNDVILSLDRKTTDKILRFTDRKVFEMVINESQLQKSLYSESKKVKQQLAYLVPSNYSQATLRQFGVDSRRIAVVPPPHTPKEHIKSKPHQTFMVAMIGNLLPEQGIETLIQALQQTQEFIPQLRVVLVGDGPEKRQLMWLIEHLHLKGRVQMVSNKDQYEKFLANIDVLVAGSSQPTLWNPVIVESMYQGVPVIATNIGSHADIITHNNNGLLFEPNNVTMLSQHILNLYNHLDWAKHYSEEASKKVATDYSFETFQKHLLQLSQ